MEFPKDFFQTMKIFKIIKNQITCHSARSRGIHLDAATARSMTRKGVFASGTINFAGW
jgi:hypothetical protein